MTPAGRIAEDTWERIKLSWALNIRFGEETLTDLLSLEFTRLISTRRVQLRKSTKSEESVKGTDLEIRIHAGGGRRAILAAVQAKRLFPSRRYEHLNAKTKSTNKPQIDTLETCPRCMGAIPLYIVIQLRGWNQWDINLALLPSTRQEATRVYSCAKLEYPACDPHTRMPQLPFNPYFRRCVTLVLPFRLPKGTWLQESRRRPTGLVQTTIVSGLRIRCA